MSDEEYEENEVSGGEDNSSDDETEYVDKTKTKKKP
jgi:hypothetical protein